MAVAGDEILYTGNVSNFNSLLTACENAAATEAKVAAYEDAVKYLEEYPIDPAAEGYAEAIAKLPGLALTCATKLYEDIDAAYKSSEAELPTVGVAGNGTKIRKLSSFVKYNDFDVLNSEYTALVTNLNLARSRYEAAKNALLTIAAENNTLADYLYELNTSNNFEGGSTAKFDYANNKYDGVEAFMGIENGNDGNNSYLTAKTGDFPSGIKHSYVRMNYGSEYEIGSVIEFDITTFGDFPTGGVISESNSVMIGNTKVSPSYFFITAEGDLCTANSSVILENAIVKGEWLHISLVFDSEMNMTIYADYEELTTVKLHASLKWCVQQFCIGANPTGNVPGTEFSLDNYTVYEGNKLRDLDYVEKITDEEKFVLYANGLSVADCDYEYYKACYEYLTAKVSLYWDAQAKQYLTTDAKDPDAVIDAVDAYFAFDYDSVVLQHKKDMRDLYISMVDEACAMTRTPQTLEDRKAKQNEIQTFVDKNTADILMDDLYTIASNKFDDFVGKITNEDNINIFNSAVNALLASTSAVMKQEHYDTASYYYDNNLLETELLNDANYKDFKTCYNKFIDPNVKIDLEDAWVVERTKRFIAAAKFVVAYDNELEWITKESEIRPIVEMAREFYLAGVDLNYGDALEVYRNFSKINNFYYQRLQEEHIEYLEMNLERFDNTELYIEKVGICDDVAKYLVTKDVDSENERIIELGLMFEALRENLESHREEYEALLEGNTNAFIAAMAKLAAANDYTSKLAVFNEANLYYATMKTDSEAALAAREAFGQLGLWINEREKTANEFINLVRLAATYYTNDEIYYALVDCCAVVDGVDMQVAGANDAKIALDAALAAYRSSSATANSDIVKLQQTVLACSSAGNSVAAAILKILFG
jgi:hypothetical protein